MQYCYVENGQIVKGPCSLPKGWKNITGFNLLSADQVKEYGWLPFREVSVQPHNQVGYDEVIEITENEVVKTTLYRPKTQDEIDQENKAKWDSVRETRDQLLRDSDWTQISDVPMTDGDKLSWAQYRQALRDITNQADPDNVVWPQIPSEGIKVAVV